MLGTHNYNFLSPITVLRFLSHIKMCLDTVTDMNETLNTVTGYNSDAAIELGHEKNFQNHGFCPLPPIIIGGLRELI